MARETCLIGEDLLVRILNGSHELIAQSHNSEECNHPLTRNELEAVLTEAHSNTPGPDGLELDFLKLGGEEFRNVLLKLFNACFLSHCFPTNFKSVYIIPIPKKDPHKFRPIALVSNLAKMYERLLHRRLVASLIDKKVIEPAQAGKWGSNAEHHLLAFKQIVLEAHRDRKRSRRRV